MAHEGSATDGKREGSAQRKGLRWRKGFQLPHVYTIIFLLMVVFAVLTWIIPSGSYERQTIETAAGEREVAVAGTYQPTEKTYLDDETGKEVDLRTDLQELLMAPTQGIQAAADVVAFVLLIGGSFGIITKTNAIKDLKRVSRPGLRRYASVSDMPRVLNGLGIAIVSTSKGIMTDAKARQENVGGEVLCYIY